MKKTLLLLSIVILGAQTGRSQVVKWFGDPSQTLKHSFERLDTESPLGRDYPPTTPGEYGTVAQQTVSPFGWTWIVHKPGLVSKRAELAVTEGTVPTGTTNTWTPREGARVFIGWREKAEIVYAGSTSPTPPTPGFFIFQDKSNAGGTQDYPLSMFYNGRKFSLNYTSTVTPSVTGQNLWTQPDTTLPGTWKSFVLEVLFSNDPTIGYVSLYVDGMLQPLNGENALHQFHGKTLDVTGNTLKWGCYDQPITDWDVKVYLNNMRIATTRYLADPNNY